MNRFTSPPVGDWAHCVGQVVKHAKSFIKNPQRLSPYFRKFHDPGDAMAIVQAELEEAQRACNYMTQDLKRLGRGSRRVERLTKRYVSWLKSLQLEAARAGVRPQGVPRIPRSRKLWLQARLALAIEESSEACQLIEDADAQVTEILKRHAPHVYAVNAVGETNKLRKPRVVAPSPQLASCA